MLKTTFALSAILFGLALPGVVRAQHEQSLWQWRYLNKGRLDLQAIKNETLLLESYTSGADNKGQSAVVAVNAATGKERWRLNFGEDYVGQILAGDAAAYVRAGNNIVALDFKTGKEKWRASFAERMGDPLLVSDTLFAPVDETGLVALDATTGRRKWSYRPCFDIGETLAADAGMVLLPCKDGKLYAVSARTGERLWRADYTENTVKHIFLNGDKVHVVVGFYRGGAQVETLSRETGKRIWEQKFAQGNAVATAASSGNRLYVSVLHGDFWMLDALTGTIIQQRGRETGLAQTRLPDGTSLMQTTAVEQINVNGDKVFTMSGDGIASAFAKDSGEIKWQFKTAGEYGGLALVTDTAVYLTAKDTLSALGRSDGKLRWTAQCSVSSRLLLSGDALYLVANRSELYAGSLKKIETAAGAGIKVLVPPRSDADTDFVASVGMGAGFGPPKEFYSATFSTTEKAYFTLTDAGQKMGALYEVNWSNGAKRKIGEVSATSLTVPAIYDGVAYVGSGQRVPAAGESFYDAPKKDMQAPAPLYAIDLATGQVLWQFATQGIIRQTPVVAKESVYVHSTDGYLYAVERRNGKFIWRLRIGASSDVIDNTDPLIAEGQLFAATQTGEFLAVDLAGSQITWRQDFAARITTFIVAEDKVVVADKTKSLSAFDARTGERRWRRDIGKEVNKMFLANGVIVCVANYSNLIGVASQTGDVLWEREMSSSPTLFIWKDTVIVQSESRLFLFDLKNGEKKRSIEALGDARLLGVSSDGIILARKNSEVITYDLRTEK